MKASRVITKGLIKNLKYEKFENDTSPTNNIMTSRY